MSKRREGMTVKPCGCITYEYGPPLQCDKHAAKAQEHEERGLRKVVRDQALALDHDLTFFAEYESRRGKWTAHCQRCGYIVIVYDAPPQYGDQINGPGILERKCHG